MSETDDRRWLLEELDGILGLDDLDPGATVDVHRTVDAFDMKVARIEYWTRSHLPRALTIVVRNEAM